MRLAAARAHVVTRTIRYASSSSSFGTFTELEHTMWQAGATAYTNSFAEHTLQAADALMDGAGVLRTNEAMVAYVEKTELSKEGRASGVRVLDVATGTGKIAELCATRGASSVVALDFSSEMLKAAQPVADAFPDVIELLEGDAQKLPLPDASFDSVIIGFGLLHFPQPELALAEAFRVLKPGGKLSFSVWAEGNPSIIEATGNVFVEEQVHQPSAPNGFEIILGSISEHGNTSVTLPAAEAGKAALPFFHFASVQNSTAALSAAGFDKASVTHAIVPVQAPLRDEEALFAMFAEATARTRALIEMQSAAELAAIRSSVAEKVRNNFGGIYSDGIHRRTSWSVDVPGVEEVMHDSTAPGKQFLGGRRPFAVPMPAVVFAATKP